MENENILTEEQKLAIAINAGATRLEGIIDNFDDCVNVENVVNQFNAEEVEKKLRLPGDGEEEGDWAPLPHP